MTKITKENLSAGLFGGGPKQSLDDFFSVVANPKPGTETMIQIEKLHPSSRNPFIVEHDEAMDELIASIKANGILIPLIIRPIENGEYEIIAGHRRFYAAKEAELTEVPCIIKEMTDEEADIIMVDTNLNRPHIRTSEKAFAYKLKYEAIKRSVGRNWNKNKDLNGSMSNGEPGSPLENSTEVNEEPGSPLGRSNEIIAKEMGVSDKTIKNYLRLTKLHPSLLELVDRKEIPLKAGVQLSYLTELIQRYVFYWMEKKSIRVDLEIAVALRKEFEGSDVATMDRISEACIQDILRVMCPQNEEKNPKKPKPSVKLDKAMKKEYFPEDYDDQAIEEVIRQLLDQWAKSSRMDAAARAVGR